jgi:CMP-N,N'-diacetyllegionaminic acid synthase
MINNLNIMAIIPARAGSKGLAEKNIKYLGNRPLIAWTIDACRKSKYLDRVVLSSDDKKIIEIAKKWGCDVPFVRPKELASDTATTLDVINHTLRHVHGYQYFVLLQPTSPLRTSEDIDMAIELCFKKNAKTCVSITESKPSSWFVRVSESGFIIKSSDKLDCMRQAAVKNYLINGAIYVSEISNFLYSKSLVDSRTVAYEMPPERSIDIDTLLDFELAEFIINKATTCS